MITTANSAAKKERYAIHSIVPPSIDIITITLYDLLLSIEVFDGLPPIKYMENAFQRNPIIEVIFKEENLCMTVDFTSDINNKDMNAMIQSSNLHMFKCYPKAIAM